MTAGSSSFLFPDVTAAATMPKCVGPPILAPPFHRRNREMDAGGLLNSKVSIAPRRLLFDKVISRIVPTASPEAVALPWADSATLCPPKAVDKNAVMERT